jgi:hypothetical protein
MKKTLFLLLFYFTIIYGNTIATNVGGIIYSDTTWTLSNSPYIMTNKVQVGNATLIIEPGVQIFGNGHSLEIYGFGTLKAIGTSISNIHISDLYIRGSSPDETHHIQIEFCQMDGGCIDSAFGTQSLILRDSVVRNISSMNLFPVTDCYIERNVFYNSHGISITNYANTKIIKNNVFYKQTYYAIKTIFTGNPSHVIVKYNSFLSTDRIALSLGSDIDSQMIAVDNFWNTTDTQIIDSMIWDRKDDLSTPTYISYLPYLTEPHPDTPLMEYSLTILSIPSNVNTVTPVIGEHMISGLVRLNADKYINCPDVYLFDHWEGDVDNPKDPNTSVFMDSEKTVTAVFIATRKCGDKCHSNNQLGDFNHDCIIDIADFAQFALNWMNCTKPECDEL